MLTSTPNNYTLGRGKLYFGKFNDGTLVSGGERYLGNTPAVGINSQYQMLDHFSSDFGTREKDDSIQIQVDRSGTFTCDNISMENIALMFGSATALQTILASTGEAQLLVVQKGFFYQLGADATNPAGIGAVSNVVVTNNAGVHANGTVTFAANPTAADTITINGQVITFVAGAPVGHQIQIGATALVTAQAFAEEINAFPHLYKVAATGATAAITLTAIASGTGGNAITMAKSGTNPTLSGATLASGTASGIIVQSGNYNVDLTNGRLEIRNDADSIADGATIEVQYNVVGGTRNLIIDSKNQVEGEMRYIADNPKGANRNWYWPHVRLSPNGEFQFKGETWQVMSFAMDVIKDPDRQTVYITG